MPYYLFRQNNVHAVMKVDSIQAPELVIEARDVRHANALAEELGLDFGDYCECCGYRWREAMYYDELKFPMEWDKDEYIQTLGDYLLTTSQQFPHGKPGELHARAFFLDGKVEEYLSKPYKKPPFL